MLISPWMMLNFQETKELQGSKKFLLNKNKIKRPDVEMIKLWIMKLNLIEIWLFDYKILFLYKKSANNFGRNSKNEAKSKKSKIISFISKKKSIINTKNRV